MATVGTIKKNNNTKNHGAALQKMGYGVTDHRDHFEVRGEGLVTSLDLQNDAASKLREVVSAHGLLTYGTKVIFEGGKTLSSVPMCLALGALCKRLNIPYNLSCLVVKTANAKVASSEAGSEAPAQVAQGWEDMF